MVLSLQVSNHLELVPLVKICYIFLSVDSLFHHELLRVVSGKEYKNLLGSSIHRLVNDIQVNVYFGNTLSRLSFQN